MTTNHHTAISTGAAANASTFNNPLGQLDTAITTNATSITANAALAATTTAEVVSARAAYSSLGNRLDALVLAGGNVATLTNGAASAGQKVVTVDNTTGFLAGAPVAYTLAGGGTETNTIDTVDGATQITLDTNIGTGGIANDTFLMMIPLGVIYSGGVAGGQALSGGTAANEDITIHGTSNPTRTTSYVLLQPTAGRVGINTAAPLAPLHVGAHTTNYSADSVVLISRLVDDAVSGNGHAFSDSSYLTRGGTMSYNSFDARIVIGGTENYGHYAAFQTGGIYNSSGTMDHYYAYVSVPSVSAGTVVNMYGAYVADPTGEGTITNNYGLYVASLTRGGTLNYGVFTAGITPSSFGGNLTAGANSLAAELVIGNQTATSTSSKLVQNGKSSGNAPISATWELTVGGLYTLSTQAAASVLSINTVTGALTAATGIIGPSWRPSADGLTALQMQNAAGTAIINVDTTNARVGIGTTAPGRMVHISSVANVNMRMTDTTNSVHLEFQAADTSCAIGAYSNHALSIFTNNATRMTFDAAGLVGIGIVAPAAKLHIDQASDTGAVPVLTVDQADVSEEFIRFIGTSTTDASQSLVDAANMTTPGAVAGWLKIYVQDDQATNPITDGAYYVPFYTAPTA